MMLHFTEAGIFVVLSVTTVLRLLPGQRFIRLSIAGALLAATLIVLDWLLGHGRWQMVLPALLCVVLLVSAIGRYRQQRTPHASWQRRLGHAAFALLLAMLLLAAFLPSLLFPMFTAPEPTGRYGVGYADIQMTDTSRAETMSPTMADRRDLMVRVWYPSDVPEGEKPMPFLKQPEALESAFPQLGAMASLVFSHLEDISSHSYARTPLASGDEAFPVLIFNHGMGLFGSANALMLENLASHGYVVFSLEHTYHASLVKFPDGRRVAYKTDWMKGSLPVSIRKMVSDMAAIQYAVDYAGYRDAVSELLKGYPILDDGISLWVDDITFLLDQLVLSGDQMNPAMGRFKGRLDMRKLGVFGMSFGGAASGVFCLTDSRCKAGVNMDGLQLGTQGDIGGFSLEVPFMLMNSDRRLEYDAYLHNERDWRQPPAFGMNDFVFHQTRSTAYTMTIAGAAHNNFTDLALISPLGKLAGMHGEVPPQTMNKIMNDYVVAFFDRHLLGVPSPLLAGDTSGHPYVEGFQKRLNALSVDVTSR